MLCYYVKDTCLISASTVYQCLQGEERCTGRVGEVRIPLEVHILMSTHVDEAHVFMIFLSSTLSKRGYSGLPVDTEERASLFVLLSPLTRSPQLNRLISWELVSP